jgi:hypothetical protein
MHQNRINNLLQLLQIAGVVPRCLHYSANSLHTANRCEGRLSVIFFEGHLYKSLVLIRQVGCQLHCIGCNVILKNSHELI